MLGFELLLKQNNIQQTELAEKIGVSKQMVNIWMKQTRPIPKKYRTEICEILNTTEEFLVSIIDEQYVNNMMLKILNKDYQYILATMFNEKEEFVDDNLIDLIKLNIKKKRLECELNQINNKLKST